MNSDDAGAPQRRKDLLVARAALERAELSLAVHDVRSALFSRRPSDPSRRKRASLIAAALVGIGVPLIGRKRLGSMLRAGSLLLTAWRVAQNWRSRDR